MLDLSLLRSDASQFAASSSSGAGFSFKYDGKIVGPAFAESWAVITTTGAQSRETVFTHRDGLRIVCSSRVVAENALEYQLRFRNGAREPLPVVSALQPLHLVFDSPPLQNCVISSCGPVEGSVLPSRSFSIQRRRFEPTALRQAEVLLRTAGGRSSNENMPFFFIHNDEIEEGVFVAFGWSGQWDILASQSRSRLEIRGRIPCVHLALEPGEEIVGPSVLVGFYKGQFSNGVNELRRTIRHAYTPNLSGRKFLPIATYDVAGFDDFDTISEEKLLKLADAAADIGLEYFLLDAGWHEGAEWFKTTGSWGVNTARFPKGLGPLAAHVRSKGMKFGLWFDVERVAEHSALAIEHPDWVLWDHQPVDVPPWFSNAPWLEDLSEVGSSQYNSASRFGLLDFGRPEAQVWAREMIDRYVKDYDVRYIRFDSNIDPLPYWNAADLPHRRGASQLRYIKGLYEVIDWLTARNPDLVLEGCSSGGRRIDLEMARRCHTFWINDYSYDPSITRFHLYGLNHFLPGSYHYIAYSLQPDANTQVDDMSFQSQFGGSLGMNGRIDTWSAHYRALARDHIAKHKAIGRFLNGDYYPLGCSPGEAGWSGWQFHDRESQAGFLQTFRVETSAITHRFVLSGLEPSTRYKFQDLYGGQAFDALGAEAMSAGLEVAQDDMTSRVLLYAMYDK